MTALEAFLVVDSQDRIALASDALYRLTGHAPGALAGKPASHLGLDVEQLTTSSSGSAAVQMLAADGQRLSVSLRSSSTTINGGVARLIAVVNATPVGAPAAPLFYDVVAHNGDRTALGAPAAAMMSNALRSGGRVAFVKARLDRLQDVNQTVGYEIGDAILDEALERLRRTAPQDGLVARLATNQFALVTPVGGMRPEIAALSETVLTRLGEPYRVRDASYRLTASVGVAVFPVHGSDLRELVQACDLALREARQRGGNRVELFSSAFHTRLSRELRLDRALSEALRGNEFDVHYQPLVDLHDGGILAAEALLRWNHVDMGEISPTEFIPRAEATGLILPIGEWVLHRAFEDAKSWEKHKAPPRVSVNLSAVQFGQEDLVETVEGVLSDTKLSPERVELELTEHSLAGDPVTRNDALTKLRDLGVTVSIDDFGTGYSSLSQLVDCPVDRLKIDRSFVTGLVHHRQSVTIVKTIIEMARNLDLGLTAEGTERKDQIDFLRDAGCQYAQGHYFYRAMPATGFSGLLAG